MLLISVKCERNIYKIIRLSDVTASMHFE